MCLISCIFLLFLHPLLQAIFACQPFLDKSMASDVLRFSSFETSGTAKSPCSWAIALLIFLIEAMSISRPKCSGLWPTVLSYQLLFVSLFSFHPLLQPSLQHILVSILRKIHGGELLRNFETRGTDIIPSRWAISPPHLSHWTPELNKTEVRGLRPSVSSYLLLICFSFSSTHCFKPCSCFAQCAEELK